MTRIPSVALIGTVALLALTACVGTVDGGNSTPSATRTADDNVDTTRPTTTQLLQGVPASDELDELLTTYAEPDAPVEPERMCTEPIVDPLAVWLTYPGERTYPVYAPVDECGFPKTDAATAFTALTLTPVVSFTSTPGGLTTTTTGLGATGPVKETS